jgi:hypothetical protein
MTQTQTTTGNKISSTYLTAIVLVVMVISIGAILLAANAYLMGEELTAGFLALIGLIAMTLSVFILYQSRRQTVEMKIEAPKVMTTIECNNKTCATKTLREFQRGDYVFKDIDVACPKCGGKQMITAIYKEVKEKEKSYGV